MLQNVFQEDLCRVEVKDVDHHSTHVKLTLQILTIDRVTLDMSVNSALTILVDFFFKDFQQIESNVVRVTLNCIREKLDVEWNFPVLHKLKGKSESASQNEDFQYLIGNNELSMLFQEVQNVVVTEKDLTINFEVVFSLVFNHHGNEIQQLNRSLLVLVNLSSFDGDQLVT